MNLPEAYRIDRVYAEQIDGIPVRTGDLICTVDGDDSPVVGQFWRLIGKLLPGDVDHIAVYVGPNGRCVEAGARGKVIAFHVPGGQWDSPAMLPQRLLSDRLYGIAYPLAGWKDPGDADRIRLAVGRYCLEQAAAEKPYNLAYPLSDIENAFYCSQLAYKAYKPHGVNLNFGWSIPALPLSGSIVYPQEIWENCPEKRRSLLPPP